MTDRIEQLERLAHLRSSGALTEEEFQHEKRLLNAAAMAEPALTAEGAEPIAVAPTATSGRGKFWVLGGLAVLAAGGVGVASTQLLGLSDLKQNDPALTAAGAAKAAPKPASGIKELPYARQLELAEQAVFGAGPTKEIGIEDGTVLSYADSKLIWSDSGAILISAGSNPVIVPNSMGALGVFYLKEVGGKFEVTIRRPDAIGGGTMGNPPEWKVLDDFGDVPMIVSESGGVWQGYQCGGTEVTALFKSGPTDVAAFASVYDETGAKGGGGEAITGKIANIVKNKSFDVRFTGTQNFTHHYVLQGDSYVRAGGAGQQELPTC